MKIVHLNSYYANGGAGRASLRLNEALQAEGAQSELYVNFAFQLYPNDLSLRWPLRGIRATKILAERYYTASKTSDKGVPFSLPVFGRDLGRHRAVREADIIHLHWINHAFLDPASISTLLKLGKPLVWTFHDSNAFTGGCHVRYDCDHFERECGNCPVLKKSSPGDLSHKTWLEKNKHYGNKDFTIICTSFWMQDSVRRSKLLGNHPTEHIPNALNTDLFRPLDKAACRQKLGLPQDQFLLLAGFMPSRHDRHKGSSYLVDALHQWVASNPEIASRTTLVIFGNKPGQQLPDLPVPVQFLGVISGEDTLADCYSAADVFVSPSLEDNLPNMVMESLACGTPVVAFTTGGIPDMVNHLENGYLAEYRSSADLASGLEWMWRHPDRKILSEEAARSVQSRFSYPIIARRHLQFYRRLLNGT